MKNDVELRFGLELECAVKPVVIDDNDIGSYHDGNKISKYWFAENDASIQTNYPFDIPVEFVSKTFKKEQLPEVINEIKEFIDGIDATHFENILINESCGAHIHFSVIGKELRSVATVAVFDKIRELVDNEFKKVLPQKIYDLYKAQYYRHYAEKNTRFFVRSANRYQEFILSIDDNDNNKGFEWRSFNLLGVTSWDTLFDMYYIAIDAIDKVIKEEFRKKKMFAHDLKIEHAFIKTKREYINNEHLVRSIKLTNSDDVISIDVAKRRKMVETIIEV